MRQEMVCSYASTCLRFAVLPTQDPRYDKMAESLHARIFLNSAHVRKASAASRLFTLLIFAYCIPSFLPSPRLYPVDTKWTLLRVSHSVTHYVLMSAAVSYTHLTLPTILRV